jgi:hypothetical protein
MASAANEKKANPQQERMKACNSQAGDKKGDERKALMSQCLKGDAAMPMTQQEKMKKCSADASAKSLKGDERKAFMSTCLKADHKMQAGPTGCYGRARYSPEGEGRPSRGRPFGLRTCSPMLAATDTPAVGRANAPGCGVRTRPGRPLAPCTRQGGGTDAGGL